MIQCSSWIKRTETDSRVDRQDCEIKLKRWLSQVELSFGCFCESHVLANNTYSMGRLLNVDLAPHPVSSQTDINQSAEQVISKVDPPLSLLGCRRVGVRLEANNQPSRIDCYVGF
jgi:hypothetical protein